MAFVVGYHWYIIYIYIIYIYNIYIYIIYIVYMHNAIYWDRMGYIAILGG